MRTAMIVAGIVLMLTGTIWILQGVNVLPGSFMTGQTKWAVIGVVTAIVGFVLVLRARR